MFFVVALSHGRRVLVIGGVDIFLVGVLGLEWCVGDRLGSIRVVVFRVTELSVGSFHGLGNSMAWTFRVGQFSMRDRLLLLTGLVVGVVTIGVFTPSTVSARAQVKSTGSDPISVGDERVFENWSR